MADAVDPVGDLQSHRGLQARMDEDPRRWEKWDPRDKDCGQWELMPMVTDDVSGQTPPVETNEGGARARAAVLPSSRPHFCCVRRHQKSLLTECWVEATLVRLDDDGSSGRLCHSVWSKVPMPSGYLRRASWKVRPLKMDKV